METIATGFLWDADSDDVVAHPGTEEKIYKARMHAVHSAGAWRIEARNSHANIKKYIH